MLRRLDRQQVGAGGLELRVRDRTLQDRAAQPVCQAARLAVGALDRETGLLEASSGIVAGSPRLLEPLPLAPGATGEGDVGLGGGLEP